MATLDISSKGNPSLIYPVLVIVPFLQNNKLLNGLKKNILPGKNISGSVTVRLVESDGATFNDQDVLKYLANIGSNIVGAPSNILTEEWITRSGILSSSKFQELKQPLEELNAHLTLRSLIAGYHINVTDLLVWATIFSNHVAVSAIRRMQNNVTRWYNYMETSASWAREAVQEATAPVGKEKVVSGANYDIDLPQISGPIVTRFPPEPSGYLHIGHAKAALLNEYFARLREGGRLICRFDDTNPTNERVEFQDSIMHDLRLINIVPDQITYSSDYFEVMYNYAVQLIKAGKAFADDSELGKGDEERRHRLPSKRRDMSIEETLARFADMKTGSAEGRRWAIRARIAYDSSNGTLRDPVIYRCNLTPHHRTGDAWKIYPTYDFCAPILDSVEGVTLALRTNEYRDRNAQYDWMQQALGIRSVPIWDFSRMNFIRTVLSKRKLTRIVDDGRVWGWDDPRMPTIRGILRRGEVVPALREFILKQGPSRNVVNMQWDVFWATNRKYIDPTAPRYTAVVERGSVSCLVKGGIEFESASKPKHPKNPELGQKKVVYATEILLEQTDAKTFAENEEITLMNWGNAFVRHIGKDGHSMVTSLDLELNIDGDVKKTDKKVTWLAKAPENLIPVDLVSFDYLITKDKLEKQDKLEQFLTPVTEFRTKAFADCNIKILQQGTIVQFERKGFFKLDKAYAGEGTQAVFFEVPTK